jgi:hypothetical protein
VANTSARKADFFIDSPGANLRFPEDLPQHLRKNN